MSTLYLSVQGLDKYKSQRCCRDNIIKPYICCHFIPFRNTPLYDTRSFVRGLKLIESVFYKAVRSSRGVLGNIILIDMRFPLNTIHYDKRLNDFTKRVRKKYVKTTVIVYDKSQITVSFNVGEIHDSKDIKKTQRNSQ